MGLRSRIANRLLEMSWAKRAQERQEQEKRDELEALERFTQECMAEEPVGTWSMEVMQIQNAARRQAIYDEEYARVVSSNKDEQQAETLPETPTKEN